MKKKKKNLDTLNNSFKSGVSEASLANWFKLANFLTKHEALLTGQQFYCFSICKSKVCCSSSYISLYNVEEQL